LAGVTAIEVRPGGALTVKAVVPETPLREAQTDATPAETEVARPLELMVATTVLEELQVTWMVRFWVLLSE
jgi:hypothetical protein